MRHFGCFPFTRKNRLVDGYSKWNGSNPDWKFPQGCAGSIYKTVPWKMVNYRASLELVGIQDGGGNAAVVRNAILVPIALFASLSRQGLGTRNEGLLGHRILKS